MAMGMDPDCGFSEWFNQQLQLGLKTDESKESQSVEDFYLEYNLKLSGYDANDESTTEVEPYDESTTEVEPYDDANDESQVEPYDDDDDDDYCYIDGPLDRHLRSSRASNVWFLTREYTFDLGVKICVPYGGKPIFGLSDECFESTWVAIHGMKSICMVTCQHMDMTRLPDYLQEEIMEPENMTLFANVAISEVECILHRDFLHYDARFRLLCSEINKEPLGVVSFSLATFKETNTEKQELVGCVSKTISFLESMVSSDSLDTDYGTIRAAIQAYQLMCLKELRAEDIWVTIMDLEFFDYDHLPVEIIREQLAICKYGRAPPPESEKPLFVIRGQPVMCD